MERKNVIKLLRDIKAEIDYYANEETKQAFNKVIEEWGFSVEDINKGDI